MNDSWKQHHEVVTLPARPRLLVVDDEPLNIQVLHQIFGEDHDVFMATSGSDALRLSRTEEPDLILLDIEMREMDGLEVCRQLKADPETSNIPVIFISAHSSPDQEAKGLGVGAVDFIGKPVSPPVVRARVKTHLMLKAQSDALRRMAFVDGLTGVANRRFFEERLAMEWRACARSRLPIALIMIDVDYFKKYNDHYGHQQGDSCLIDIAGCLKNTLGRSRDLLCRYGGEEFVCLLPETDSAGGAKVAERMRAMVEALAIPHLGNVHGGVVTVSLGVAAKVPGLDEQPKTLLRCADEQLYAAKGAGRNRVSALVGQPASAITQG